jgi:hypothetical protein
VSDAIRRALRTLFKCALVGTVCLVGFDSVLSAQPDSSGAPGSPSATIQTTPITPATAEKRIDALTQEVQDLRSLVRKLEHRIDELEAGSSAPAAGSVASNPTPAPPQVAPAPAAATASSPSGNGILQGATINAMLDGYYEYNANNPIGRVNYLRAYDVSSNSFSLNQADLLLESAADLAAGKRYGMRLDLQFGQATETLQGSLSNELRPEIWRNIFQAYGTYIFPINGEPLVLDFGKWASSLGFEGNYTKDQINYSRSLWFDYLPFYHSGLRAAYKVDDVLTLDYWITNGTQQTEAFNNFKDQMYGFVLQPITAVVWTFNYYLGQEHPDIVFVSNPGPGDGGLPSQQGTPFEPIPNAPTGRLRILDTYVTWQATAALSFDAESDLVFDRLYTYSLVQRTQGGAMYGRYQITPRIAVALRGEYMEDRGGLFSGVPQFLKEGTFTTEYRLADGFLVRAEFRRDESNRAYFLTDTLGLLKDHQDTATIGVVWWLGQKTGTW